jgi:hypothetical protein
MMQYVSHKNKRNKRRAKREALLGPERLIKATASGAHLLECGHQVLVAPTELPHIKRRRCAQCRTPTAWELNQAFLHVPEEYRPELCEGCGSLNSMVEGQCRECGHRNGAGSE